MNAREKQERNERILANATRLGEIRDIAREVLGSDVSPAMVHLICSNMRINGEMDVEILSGDLKNARGLTEQIYGAEFAKDSETVVSVYEDCTAKEFDDDED